MNRIQKTFLSVFFGRGILAIRQLLIVPILIHYWGVSYYGAWLVLSAIPSFLSSSNLGLGTSAHISISVAIAAGKHKEAAKTFSTALLMISSIGAFMVVGSFLWSLWWSRSYTGAIESPWFILPLLLLSLFIRMLGQPFYGYWFGIGKPATANNLANLLSLGESILSITIPLMGGKALTLTCFMFAWSLVWWLFTGNSTLKMLKQNSLLPDRYEIDWKAGKNLVATGLGHELSPLWQAILFQGSLVLAGSLLGNSGAALWGSLRIATRSGNQLLELVGQSLGPEFQLAYGAGDWNRIRKIHSVGLMISTLLSGIVTLFLMTFGLYLFGIWTHHSFLVSKPVWYFMTLSLVPYALWYSSGEFLRSTNQPWSLNLWAFASSVVAVACMAAGSKIGILGFAFGSFVFEICMMAFVLPKTLSMIGDNLHSTITNGFGQISTTLLNRRKLKSS